MAGGPGLGVTDAEARPQSSRLRFIVDWVVDDVEDDDDDDPSSSSWQQAVTTGAVMVVVVMAE